MIPWCDQGSISKLIRAETRWMRMLRIDHVCGKGYSPQRIESINKKYQQRPLPNPTSLQKLGKENPWCFSFLFWLVHLPSFYFFFFLFSYITRLVIITD